jgi:hypothetical protein
MLQTPRQRLIHQKIQTSIQRCAEIDKQVLSIVHSILYNIVKFPEIDKFRRIRTTHEKIKLVISTPSALQVLLLSGFVKTKDVIYFPKNGDSDTLKPVLNEVKKHVSA